MFNPFLMTLTVLKLLFPTKYCKAYFNCIISFYILGDYMSKLCAGFRFANDFCKCHFQGDLLENSLKSKANLIRDGKRLQG